MKLSACSTHIYRCSVLCLVSGAMVADGWVRSRHKWRRAHQEQGVSQGDESGIALQFPQLFNPPNFFRQVKNPIFWRQFFPNSEPGEDWLKDSLVYQHIWRSNSMPKITDLYHYQPASTTTNHYKPLPTSTTTRAVLKMIWKGKLKMKLFSLVCTGRQGSCCYLWQSIIVKTRNKSKK